MGFRTGDRALERGPDEQGGGRGGRARVSHEVHDPSRQAHDLKGVPDLPDDPPFGAFVGDRAFDADWHLQGTWRSAVRRR